jgi:glyoxylase-like metal-dependent hydrolase (beta-lactamase superfamily II)/ketosteroid isomerase-like protein
MTESESASEAAAKVQEVAATMNQASTRRGRISGSKAESIARRYFEAIGAHDAEAAAALWAPDGCDALRGQPILQGPEEVREFIASLIGALPDLQVEILSTTTEGDRCALQWRFSGTFAGPGAGSFGALQPTGDPITLEGVDLLTVRDGLIQCNDAFTDTLAFPRQIGMMPPLGSSAEQRLMGAFNAKTRVSTKLAGSEAQLVAEGVWVVQGQPGRCNVYLLEDEDGVTLFDAGARTMARAVASAGAKLGGIKRIVLGHGHTDHRGVAPALGVPTLCHPEEVQDAEGSGGFRYWPADLASLPTPQRQIHRLLHRYAWDGGPVKIAGTVKEGDEVAGFRVVHLPGHAPGLIGLWRESDRLALVSDCFYTLDMWGRGCPPHVPEATYNFDTAQARESIRKLASLEPAAAWPGHAKPATGDVRSQLEHAADAP